MTYCTRVTSSDGTKIYKIYARVDFYLFIVMMLALTKGNKLSIEVAWAHRLVISRFSTDLKI